MACVAVRVHNDYRYNDYRKRRYGDRDSNIGRDYSDISRTSNNGCDLICIREVGFGGNHWKETDRDG